MSSTEALVAGRSWELADMPDQAGRTILVTGPTHGGIGYHTALELARRGARVVLAGRDPARVDAARSAITREVPEAELDTLTVDVSEFGSVRHAASRAARFGAIDVLIDNAGVMAPQQQLTGDGLELQMATNHFGPFLLTGLLLPQLAESADGRVVVVTSLLHRLAGAAPLADPRQPGQHYARWRVYARSKLANLLFAAELERRCRVDRVPVRALTAHPGLAATHLAANGRFGRSSGGGATILDATMKAVAQPAAEGALPILMAATAPLPGGIYCVPGGPGQLSGRPRVANPPRSAGDEVAARRLWELSEVTVGLRYP